MDSINDIVEKFVRTEDEEYLNEIYKKFQSIIYSKISSKYLLQKEFDDVLQEIQIQIWLAIYNYNTEKGDIFYYICKVIDNTITDYYRYICACKRDISKEAYSLNEKKVYNGEELGEKLDNITDESNVEDQVIENIEYKRIKKNFGARLTRMERIVLDATILTHIRYKSERDISVIEEMSGLNKKQIDNATRRVKLKASNYFSLTS